MFYPLAQSLQIRKHLLFIDLSGHSVQCFANQVCQTCQRQAFSESNGIDLRLTRQSVLGSDYTNIVELSRMLIALRTLQVDQSQEEENLEEL